VHGKGGEVERLQKIANTASRKGDMGLYMSTRAEIEALTDDKTSKLVQSFRENSQIETWRDSSGTVLADTPNKTLVGHLYRSASHEVAATDQVTELLKIRGYGDQDLLLAKHFGFEKDGNPSTNTVTARKLTRLTDEIEASHGVRYPPANKETFINKYFARNASTTTADRALCKRFVEDYAKYVTKQ
jgi:hypothetical protein